MMSYTAFRWGRRVVSVISVGLGLVLFTNCGDVSLEPVQVVELSSLNQSEKYCSDPGFAESDVINFVFVVDMSQSNVVLPNGGTMVPGTDQAGKRFEVIQNFLNSSCLAERSSIRISIVGFSTEAVTQGGVACQASLFTDKAGGLAQIAHLESVQDSEQPQILAGGSTRYMNRTHYLEGLTCVDGIVRTHLQSLPVSERAANAYQVYFLTDGLPNDSAYTAPGGNALTNPSYKPALEQKISTVLSNSASSAGLRIAPIFYGTGFLSANELALATDIIDFIAAKGNSVKTLVDDVDAIDFCGLLRSGRKDPFTVKKFGAVNLNMKLSGGIVKVDSDMDGLSDDDEILLGYDPANPRSATTRILDGLCPRGSTRESCAQSFSSATVCGESNGLGLNRCDLESRSLGNGIDSDFDDLPDIVEIVKGLSPNTALLRDQNIDQDGLLDRQEVDLGRDPFSPDDGANADFLLRIRHQQDPEPNPTCASTQESWKYFLDYVPLVRTVAVELSSFSGPQDQQFFDHKKDENTILLYYIVEKVNHNPSIRAEAYLFGKLIRVQYDTPGLDLGDFKFLGKIE